MPSYGCATIVQLRFRGICAVNEEAASMTLARARNVACAQRPRATVHWRLPLAGGETRSAQPPMPPLPLGARRISAPVGSAYRLPDGLNSLAHSRPSGRGCAQVPKRVNDAPDCMCGIRRREIYARLFPRLASLNRRTDSRLLPVSIPCDGLARFRAAGNISSCGAVRSVTERAPELRFDCGRSAETVRRTSASLAELLPTCRGRIGCALLHMHRISMAGPAAMTLTARSAVPRALPVRPTASAVAAGELGVGFDALAGWLLRTGGGRDSPTAAAAPTLLGAGLPVAA